MSDGSDARMAPRDPKFQQIGVGLHNSFLCGACQQHRSQFGRHIRLIKRGPLRGLRAWVCKECSK